MEHTFAIKGHILYTPDRNNLIAKENSYLVCENGRVAGVFAALPECYHGIMVEDYENCLVVPGLCDLHLHAPQYTFRSLGMDMELLPWLNAYAFPEEAKYKKEEYARKAYSRFSEAMRKSATTRAAMFGTLHVPATRILMDLMEKTGIKAYVGKVNMDRNCPDILIEPTQESIQNTERWIEECVGCYKNIRPILTPRFIPSCTDSLMEQLGRLQQKYQLPVQSHLSENRGEIALVQEEHPDTGCYGEAYDKFGLFGGTCPTIMAHCVHPNETELALMKRRGVFVAHCPQSNTNLCSGIAPTRTYLEQGLPMGLGSDVAGGADLSIFRAMADAIRVSKLRWSLLDDRAAPLSVTEAFYLGTKGGGSFWGKVGSFEKGYEFDAVVIDDRNLELWDNFTLTQRLERVVYLSDDRHLRAKYIAGVKAW